MNKKIYVKINNTTWYLRIRLSDLVDSSYFQNEIHNHTVMGKTYLVLAKTKHSEDQYFMLDSQKVFTYNSVNDIIDLHDSILLSMSNALDKYNNSISDTDLEYVILKFTETNRLLLSDITYDKSRLHNTPINNLTKNVRIPIKDEGELLGQELKVIQDNEITKLVLPKPHEDVNVSLDMYNNTLVGKTKTYFRDTKPPSLLSITNISDNTREKSLSTVKGSNVITVLDTYSDNNVVRTENKTSKNYVINNNEIVSFSKETKFNPIIKKPVKVIYHPSPLIGTIDLETYYDSTLNLSKVYAAGFKTYLSDDCVIEYIDRKTMDSNKVIINIIKEILRPKYENIKFYIHNLGHYDGIFIIRALYEYNLHNEDKFIVDPIFNNDRILKITIKTKVGNKMWKTTLLDSIPMLNSSLRDLGIKYEVDTVKSYFPYRFVEKNTLFYKGTTPSIDMYENINQDIYDTFVSDSWDLKSETIKYLKKDLISLFEILNKFSKNIYKTFDVDFIDSLTISSLSLNIFLKNYYDTSINPIPNIRNKTIYSDIKKAYYGGITEVYMPKGIDLFYYDVNSLYPFVAKNSMVGLNVTTVEYSKYEENLDNIFGFYFAEVDNTDSDIYIGLLPYRTESGLLFPIGKWKGWYFSEELIFAKKYGYKIKIVKGYNFDKQNEVFNKYVDYVYSLKSNTKDSSERTMAKSLLNNLLGRFGMDITKPVTKIVDNETYEKILHTSSLISEIKITKDIQLIKFIPTLNSSLANKLSIDPQKVFDKFEHLTESEFDKGVNKFVSIAISAAITSYARIYITKLKLDIINKGGKIYYSDTDSIVTDLELDSSLVSQKLLGKLKLEHEISEGYFITNKTYAFINKNGKLIKRSKGLDSDTLSYQDYIDMYNEKEITSKTRLESIKDYVAGSVNLEKREILLNPNNFKKREKVYMDGKWVDTKPIKI